MPQQTKIFRVFVSSTFTDMKEERRILQKEVFPRLETYCEEHGAKFQAVDLRWGVNEESQLNQKTLDICLNEIARCQRISPKPNFIILLGNKYGWQPIPTTVPQSEMEQIFDTLTTEDITLIDQWYRLDVNATPAAYVLQPREHEYKDYNTWQRVETHIRSILRHSVLTLPFAPARKTKYFASATHQEIMSGALNPPEGTEKPEAHVVALVRDVEGLPDDTTAVGYVDLVSGGADQYCRTQLANLKKELKDKLGDHFMPYRARWDNGKSVIVDATQFANRVYAFLKAIIEQQIKEVITPDEIDREITLHKEFRDRLVEHFRGRDGILGKIRSYLESSEHTAMSMIGESGSGKSSVFAEAIRQCEHERGGAVVVYRFIGTTSSSSNIISLLRSVCGQIARECGVSLQSLAGEGNEKALYATNGLTEVLKKCLALGTAHKPIILFLDALDQLSDSDGAKALYWVPWDPPLNAKCLVSALPDLGGRVNGANIERLPLLPMPDAKQILDVWFKSIGRTLSDVQYEEVLDRFSHTGLAIFLRLAFEKARHWHSYDKEFTLQRDVKGIIDGFVEGLEREHTRDFVKHVLCYMLCGKYSGLAESEILEVLVFDTEYWSAFLGTTQPEYRQDLQGVTKMPIVVWSRLYLDLEPFLTERDADGIPIITFFHRQFVEVLKDRYDLREADRVH